MDLGKPIFCSFIPMDLGNSPASFHHTDQVFGARGAGRNDQSLTRLEVVSSVRFTTLELSAFTPDLVSEPSFPIRLLV
jgi:hypothetical protein